MEELIVATLQKQQGGPRRSYNFWRVEKDEVKVDKDYCFIILDIFKGDWAGINKMSYGTHEEFVAQVTRANLIKIT